MKRTVALISTNGNISTFLHLDANHYTAINKIQGTQKEENCYSTTRVSKVNNVTLFQPLDLSCLPTSPRSPLYHYKLAPEDPGRTGPRGVTGGKKKSHIPHATSEMLSVTKPPRVSTSVMNPSRGFCVLGLPQMSV